MREASGEGGFVLVEAVAAVAIVAMCGAALMTALNAAQSRAHEAQTRALALRQAKHLINEAVPGTPGHPLSSKGEMLGLSWSRTISAANQPYPGLQHVAVEVVWKTAKDEGTTRLEGYRIAHAPPQ